MNRKRARAIGKPRRRKRQPVFEAEVFRTVRKPDPPDFERQMERINRRMRRLHGPPINDAPAKRAKAKPTAKKRSRAGSKVDLRVYENSRRNWKPDWDELEKELKRSNARLRRKYGPPINE
jgi:hypothetical protein